MSVTNEKGNALLKLIDKNPEGIISYTYQYSFEKFLYEEIPAIYEYSYEFGNYFVEQSDGWIPPINYTYDIEFTNYLTEQENI